MDQNITDYIRRERGLDLTGYRQTFLQRRLTKRFHSVHCTNSHEYLNYLKENACEIDSLLNELAINVSWFYRHPLGWELLKETVIPKLIKAKIRRNDPLIRIWSAGCSRGEEPYTIAMLFRQALEAEKEHISFQIFATDVNQKALLFAKKGIYRPNVVENLPYGLLTKYFTAEHEHFRVKSILKENVLFSEFNLLSERQVSPAEAVFADFDLIVCQNVLIYYQPHIQKKIIIRLRRSLQKGLYLMLGDTEEPLGSEKLNFNPIAEFGHIYIKN